MGHATGRPPDAVYKTRIVPTPPPPPSTRGIYWDNGIWRTRLSESQALEIDIFDRERCGWHPAATMSEDFSTGELLVPAPPPGATGIRPLYHPQDRAVILGRMCRIGGVMMHSSSIMIDGRILVFAGKSGVGKTTLARLWRAHGATLLNDERTLIHARNGSVRAGASPWHGEENQVHPATGPLAGLFFLNQAATNRLTSLALSDSLPAMLTTAFIPVFIPDGPAHTIEACHAILERVPAYGMDFTPDIRALDLCRTVL